MNVLSPLDILNSQYRCQPDNCSAKREQSPIDYEGGIMKKHLVISCGILLALFLGMSAPQYAQNAPVHSDNPDHAKRSLAIKLVRAINTAELDYKFKHGVYATWDTLVTSEDFTSRGIKWAAQNDSQLANLQFSKGSDILPGWRLRLNLTVEGKGYDLLLEDVTDKQCGYAALTDERGVIRQGKAIDCEI